MKIQTIEIKSKDLSFNKELVRYIFLWYINKEYFHFFYEPHLVIRTEPKIIRKIKKLLKKYKNLKHRVYDYPFGRGYGESKKGIVVKHLEFFKPLFNINSILAAKRSKKDDEEIIERYTHTFINTLGYEWEDESLWYLHLAYGRVGCIKKYADVSFAVKVYCGFLMFLIRLTYKLTKGLK